MLRKCPECEHEMSSKTEARCPRCGYKKRPFVSLGGLLLLAIFIGIIWFCIHCVQFAAENTL